MKVQAIQSTIDAYIQFILSPKENPWTYQYDVIDLIHEKWDLNATHLADSLNLGLDSNVSRRLWHRENFDAKKMMILFLKAEPDYCKQMFRDLYDESRKVEARVDRFKFYCEELLQMYRLNKPKEIITNHDQDATMISLYLTGKYPEKYAIYPGITTFQKVIQKFESPQPLLVDDLARFFKVCNILHTIGFKNQKR